MENSIRLPSDSLRDASNLPLRYDLSKMPRAGTCGWMGGWVAAVGAGSRQAV